MYVLSEKYGELGEKYQNFCLLSSEKFRAGCSKQTTSLVNV